MARTKGLLRKLRLCLGRRGGRRGIKLKRADKAEKLGNSAVQHGRLNDRIYLMKLAERDCPGIVQRLDRLAKEKGYSKIFAKVPAAKSGAFLGGGYAVEARVPKMYNCREDALFLGKFLKGERAGGKSAGLAKKTAAAAMELFGKGENPKLPPGMSLGECGPADAAEMARLYASVFESYPFPISSAAYLKKTMGEDTVYFGVREGGRLVSLSSAEIDRKGENAEITDFATLPGQRGRGLAKCMLREIENRLRKEGIKTAYTICRGTVPPVNIIFAKAGYEYGGTLVNNTNIAGSFESMNVWHKSLATG